MSIRIEYVNECEMKVAFSYSAFFSRIDHDEIVGKIKEFEKSLDDNRIG